MLKKVWFQFGLSILSMVLILFIALPVIRLITGPGPEMIINTVLEKEVYSSILLTFAASLTATVIALILGVPMAYLLARHTFPGKSALEGIISLPVIIPHTAAGIALLTVFGDRFLIGAFFSRLGVEFMGRFAGIVIAMLFVSLPFLVNEAKEGFRSLDIKLERVARTLGATPAKAFFRVALPLNKAHIISGALMMWARGLSEFGAVIILAYHPMTASVLIFERFTSYGLKYSTPVASIMLLTSFLIFIILKLVNRDQKEQKE